MGTFNDRNVNDNTGCTGQKGERGLPGQNGDKGDPGARGAKGDKGNPRIGFKLTPDGKNFDMDDKRFTI